MTGASVGPAPAPGSLFELPPELAIDTRVARRIMVGFIRGQLRQAGFERAVLGLSGGIDSAVVAFLAAEAIGPERLLCVLMPYRTSSSESLADARLVVEGLGCASRVVEISRMVDAYFGPAGAAEPREPREPGALGPDGASASGLRRGNFMARVRMAVLYDLSASWGGLVVGTGNKTEVLIGYTTHFGDDACAFDPVGDLYKSQLRQVAVDLGVPEQIIAKPPSADLWPGQTDEAEVGFSYAELDRLLYWMVDRRRSPEELAERGFDPRFVERVGRMVAGAEFKRQVPPIAKLGPRTSGVDYLYPRRRPAPGT
ncbi:MAG: NAD+ synthase [Candidatus Limnocylindrales bacterium]